MSTYLFCWNLLKKKKYFFEFYPLLFWCLGNPLSLWDRKELVQQECIQSACLLSLLCCCTKFVSRGCWLLYSFFNNLCMGSSMGGSLCDTAASMASMHARLGWPKAIYHHWLLQSAAMDAAGSLSMTFAHKHTLNSHTWSLNLVEIWKHSIYQYLLHLLVPISVQFSLILLSIRGCVVSKFLLMLLTAKIVLPYMYRTFFIVQCSWTGWYNNILILILLLHHVEWRKLYLLCNEQIGKTGLLQAAQIRFYVNKRQAILHRPASWPRPHPRDIREWACVRWSGRWQMELINI